MAYCELLGAVKDYDGTTIKPGKILRIKKVLPSVASSTVFDTHDAVYKMMANGTWKPPIRVEREAVAYIHMEAPGFDRDSIHGTPLAIPDSATAQLATLPIIDDFPETIPVLNPPTLDTSVDVLEVTDHASGKFWDMGGAVFNLRKYLTADGSTDDTAALQSLINSLPATGAILELGGCENLIVLTDTIQVGDGSSAAISSKQNIVFRGISGQVSEAFFGAKPPGFRWAGTSGGKLFNINGPIGGVKFQHIYCDGDGLADTFIDAIGAKGILLEDFQGVGHLGWGFKIDWYGSGAVLALMPDKADAPTLRNVYLNSTHAGSSGLLVGATSSISQLDASLIRFTLQGGSNVGMELGVCDNCQFRGLVIPSLVVKPRSGLGQYPENIRLENTAIGSVTIDESEATWLPSNGSGLICDTFNTADGAAVPIHKNIWGMMDRRSFFSPNVPLNSIDAVRTLNLMSATPQGADLGAMLGIGGHNGFGGAFEVMAFITIAGRKENSTAGNFKGYGSFCTSDADGNFHEAMRIDSAQRMLLYSVPVYANNAAAVAGGLAVGTLYRTGADPDLICIVH